MKGTNETFTTRLNNALKAIWRHGLITTKDKNLDDTGIESLREYLVVDFGIDIHLSDNELSCLWRSFVKNKTGYEDSKAAIKLLQPRDTLGAKERI
ncbi:MAG: hypothetical protein HQK98_06995 [Nitrospirae bacterium]|nr:hypothetical protein [Nitrospirota bacterium]